MNKFTNKNVKPEMPRRVAAGGSCFMGLFPKWLGVFLKCVRFQSAWIGAEEVE